MQIWLIEKLKEHAKILLLITAIVLLFLGSFWQWIGVFLLLIGAWLFQDTFKDFLQTLLTIGVIALAVVLIFYWWNETPLFGKKITDSIILILITGLYSIFTYMILNSNKESFDISRLPLIHIRTIADSIGIVNDSNKFKAENIEVKIELDYPIPNSKIEKLKQMIKKLYLKYKGYEIIYKINEIPPLMTEWVSFEFFLKDILKLPKRDFDGNPDRIDYRSENPIRFQINVAVSYQTDTGFTAPKNIKGKFVFYCNNSGCDCEQIGPNVLRIK